MALLTVEHITMKFGGLVAVNDFDLALEKNEIVGLIGPNGAGKTTVFNMIAGYYTPTEGAIRFMGNPIGGQKANRITKAGIARTFQNIRLFSELSVIENVMIGYHCRIKSTFLGATLRLPALLPRGEDDGRGGDETPEGSGPRGRGRGRCPRPCPTASSAGSRSHGRLPRGRSSFSWTSRPPG